jgi:putative transposase
MFFEFEDSRLKKMFTRLFQQPRCPHLSVMDEKYLMKAVRYVAMNPVRAGIVKRPEQYRWSSASAYLRGTKDPLVNFSGLNERVDDWSEYLRQAEDIAIAEKMRKYEQTGRPLGSDSFVMKLEKILDRMLRPKKPGPKSKERTDKMKKVKGN